MHYVIHAELRLVECRVEGTWSIADIQAFRSAIVCDPAFRPEFDEFIDTTAVTSFQLTTDEVKALAAKSPFAANSRRVLLAVQPVIFGMARMFETYHELSHHPSHFRVFSERGAALEFLNLTSLPE